jgi:hypothetical protein
VAGYDLVGCRLHTEITHMDSVVACHLQPSRAEPPCSITTWSCGSKVSKCRTGSTLAFSPAARGVR